MANIENLLRQAQCDLGPRACLKVLREVFKYALHRERRHAPQAAKRALQHRLAQILEKAKVTLPLDPGDDAIDDLHAASRADAAGRALTAGFDRTELHGITCHLRHIDRVVKDYDTAVTQECPDCRQGFIIDRGVELRSGDKGPEGASDLHGPDR